MTLFTTLVAPVTGRTTTVAVCCEPVAMVAHVHVNVPPVERIVGVVHVGPPVVAESERKRAFDGNVSVMVTAAAVDGPLLRAVMT
jgi:hypothetical protein